MKQVVHMIIGGNRWELHELTPKLNRKYLKVLGEARKDVTLRGFCHHGEKRIYLRPGQSKQDEENTLLHEGLHAILLEVGFAHGLDRCQGDEKTVSTLTSEILGFMKQTTLMPA